MHVLAQCLHEGFTIAFAKKPFKYQPQITCGSNRLNQIGWRPPYRSLQLHSIPPMTVLPCNGTPVISWYPVLLKFSSRT